MISDIHGNETAFRAVLADIRRLGADRVVCLGDVACLGPSPVPCLDLLREASCPCVMGNHDDFLLQPSLIERYTQTQVVVESVDWCRDRISGDDLEFIRGFRAHLTLDLGSERSALLFHGSPTSHMENLLATTPEEELDRLLAGHVAPLMVGGHTHLQMLRQHKGNLLLNPGSVGLPFREHFNGRPPRIMAHAEYALVEATSEGLSVTTRRVGFDVAAHRKKLAGSDLPMRDWLLGQYR